MRTIHAAATTFTRALFPFPQINILMALNFNSDITASLRDIPHHNKWRLDKKFENFRPTNIEIVDPLIHRLWHPLSALALEAIDADAARPLASQAEELVLNIYVDDIRDAVNNNSYMAWHNLLIRIASELRSDTVAYRTHSCGLQRDRNGVKIRFPPPKFVESRMRDLFQFIQSFLISYPFEVSVIAMVAITNCHPFEDANGRTSRIIFNGLLRAANATLGYVPLYELFWLSGRGYEIRMRIAETRYDWVPLLEYMRAIIVVAGLVGERSSRLGARH